MAKRRADDCPLLLHAHDSPSKRLQRSVCAAAAGNTHLETGRLSPEAPEPPAHDSPLPGNRCRKRPHHFSTCPEPDVYLHCKTTNCEALTVPSDTNGTVQDQTTSSSNTRRNKRAREDSETHIHDDDDDDNDDDDEDCAYNSFQYWRVPLPELDLSLLDDVSRSHTDQRSKVKQANVMIM